MKKKTSFQDRATLFLGDCLKILPKIEAESIDFIVTDPPYQAGHSIITRNGQKDLNSDFGEWDIFFTEWVVKAYKVLKQDSGMVIFVPATRYETLWNACYKAGFEPVQPWFFFKENPPPTMRRGLQWAVEHMMYVVKGKHKLRIENKGKCHNVFKYPSVRKDRFHPTQKPVELMQDIIKYVSDKGQMILDPFSGSSATGIAALGMERKYIGIEKNEEYYKKSVKRLSVFFNDVFV